MPRISVIISNFNGASHLDECIRSVLCQTFSEFELLILDAGSTDNSIEIIDKFKDPRIRLIQKRNIGLGEALNLLIDACQADLIARMDSDDVMTPNRLQDQYDLMLKHEDCVLSGTQILYYNGHHTLKRTPFPIRDQDIKSDLAMAIFSLCHPAIIFRRNVCLRIGKYQVNGFGEDLDFMLRMGQEGRLLNTETIGLYYRYSNTSVSASKRKLINCAYAFTVQTIIHGADLDFLEFEKYWSKRPFAEKVNELFTNLGDSFYGKYIMSYGQNNFASRFYLLCSAILKPKAVFRHLARRINFF